MIGESAAMRKVFQLAEQWARSAAPVIITGETGTGKEMLARRIHDLSPRRHGAFVPVNCGAIPEELAESELFGHVKGAFTGAIRDHKGKFRRAHHGTLLLDEIVELGFRLQIKLLRVLQDGEVEPVGCDEPEQVSVRVISATHRDLWRAVQEGQFREDLYYRLNVLPVSLPPLRERKDDIALLLQRFFEQQGRHYGESPVRLDPRALRYCLDYAWPGNVRELENVAERLTVQHSHGVIQPEDLPATIRHADPDHPASFLRERMQLPAQGIDLNAYIATVENELMTQALRMSGYNKTQAALLLRMNRGALMARLRRRQLNGHGTTSVLLQ